MNMGATGSSVVLDCVRNQVVRFSGADKPAKESGRGAWRHNELSPLSMTASTRRRLSNQKASSGGGPAGGSMQVVYARCAGLDVHKKTVSDCVSVCEPEGGKQQQMRVFGTFTSDLLALADWLKEQGVTRVAMEATGI